MLFFPSHLGKKSSVSQQSNDADQSFLSSESHAAAPSLPLQIRCLQIDFSSPKTGSVAGRGCGRTLSGFLRVFLSGNWQREDINFASFIRKWIQHPMNIALLVWFIFVAASSTMQGLLLLGMLNKKFPQKDSRNRWIEINNQVLNALFTLMSLYQHPSLFHHSVLLCRGRGEDMKQLRNIYCKNRAKKGEQGHILALVILLHITCLSQYVLCGLYWGYTINTRPEFYENLFNVVGFIAPVMAGAYAMYGPLGREEDHSGVNKEENSEREMLELKKLRTFVHREWKGGIFDCRDDISVGLLSFFCSLCVFGWNMERLGFGNMYVHISLFFLLCSAPLWIFGISAMHIGNEWVRNLVGGSGMLLSVCGLMYGGYWRVKMRERFELGGNGGCCRSETAMDYLKWVFCCWCALAQEVRTGNFYGFGGEEEEEEELLICPLPREGRVRNGEEEGLICHPKRPPFQQLMQGSM